MKIPAPDNRKPIAVALKLDAATYDLAQQYKNYRAQTGDRFATDSQLVCAIVEAFMSRGDNDFRRWLKTAPPEVMIAPVKAEKKAKKANGIDLAGKTNSVDLSGVAQYSLDSEKK